MANRMTTHFSARKRLIATAISACFVSAPAWGNPTAPQVVNGSASFNQAGKLLTVNNSNGAIINWNTFSIGAGETTRFNQTSATSSVLNRVLANDPSVLLGTLSSNGRVWLVNPAGIMVGQGARIDVAGFIASTLNVRNEDFLAGRLNFGATPNAGRIENRGHISTPSGGSVYLVAPAVENNGIINAPNGEVMLAAGQTVQLVDTGTPGVKVDITGTEGKATNLGEIIADAGRIGMAGVLVKNSGTLNASSLVRDGGRIFLKASQDAIAGGTISANSETGAGGRIEVAAAAVSIPGGAVLDASGETRGGAILVGGGYQGKDATIANATSATIEDSASLKANAIGSGDGGLIVAWSDGATRAHGSFSARGGESGGRGGLVETSGKQSLNVAGARVDTRAADGSAGTWLLDPADITIVNGTASASGSPDYAPTGSASSITDADINKSLETTNVSITTSSGSGGSGNITVNGYADAGGYAYISTTGSAARTLTLNADGNIDIHGGASIYGNTSAPLTLNLYAGGGISHAGNISNFASATFLAKGAIKFGDGSYSGSVYSYGSPVVMLANWDGVSTSAPVIAASGQCGASSFCGINGSGYIDSYAYSSSTVSAGAVSVKAPGDVDLSGINISARGGNGYNYGSAGGPGGVVSIASTMGNLSTGSMDASGGAGNSGTYGSSSAVNGGSGGVGGAGGTVNLSAAGTLTLGGTTRVNGGAGGQGGSGYYTWDSATSSYVYSGTGGNGGAGGNAGTISASSTSLHLSAATLNAHGGAGGTGGQGSSAGAAGANGTASPVTLATAGDIAVTGYNYVDASQVNLLAGKNIVFGTTGTSPTNGYLYSNHNYGSPLTMVANWNGSTSAPDIAASGQCADGGFCGISGSGAIDNNYYYYSSTGNAAAVTLKAPGDIDLSSIAIYARGDGGYSYGSNGGAGGAVSVTSTQGNLSTGQIDASGGSGYSGSYASSSVVDGGAAGAGGAGGTVSLSAAGALTLGGTISVSGAYGGYGGSGYSVWDSGTSTYTYSGTGGNGGAGGNAGTISASGASLLMSGATLNARGGPGGTGGQGTSVGLAGGGGKAGTVILTATTGDLGSGSIDASGGSGGSGAYGVNGAVNGGAGGAGGAGGTVSLSTPAALTLKGTTSVAGGQAGGGASAYSTYDSGTSSYVYSGSGGNGGAGGDAGTMGVSGASLVLSGATLNAYGGVGGSGGQGTAAGIAGARGSASPITLATAGDIGVTGYNYVDASELNLLSGKNITFGTAGASPANGYLHSNGASIVLLANWDGVSATAPAIAASGQCTDGSFCGISGSGSIDSNYYYFYSSHANAGAVSLKAPGDIDLSDIAIYARGNSGYNYGDVGGAGGTVSIASTKGNLSTGYIDASGGSGDTGSYGTSSGVNGGTGGAGGAGGAINLSAPGTLTFGGTTYVSGGHGGQGGSGYYTWDSGTSRYVYSGTGGTGGAGGNAGSINANGASLVLTGATLYARGGSGGSGGQGTTAGLAGGGGTGGNITVAATTGDLTTGYIDAHGGSGGSGAYGVGGGVNAGAGGAGGAGGTVSLSAPGTLTLSGTTGIAGGQGGGGASGYSTYDSATSSYVYSGTGGNGGAGGNAGTLSVNGASLVLSGATLNALGGSGGTGGLGTTAGSAGARGSSSPITLSTAGDIGVSGSNYVEASELKLLAGKSIAFGTTGASSTSGYLNSDGTHISLLANWDGISTTAPAIATSGQCADGSFCGISGSGSIDSNYYYYYYYDSSLADAGAVTFKAPGDIDLTNIDIYARGSSGGSGYGSNGGAGGVVNIASTKGNLTTGHIDAGGGAGASGSYGTSTVADGGTGGAGGAGGTVNLSAAGTLTLGGTTGVRGGNGGYGGSGYNTWDSGTSTYVYSGTGGNGGTGGNAGTINASSASLVLSNATLNAQGGSGGSGGYYGTSAGSAGARGAASPVTLSTSGDIAVTGSNYVNSNQFNLLAGGSISFGTSGASATSGYLYSSHGSPVTLVANWNGSTAAPDAAGTAQCGTVFCGIGGTGGISTNYYYYYEDESQSKDGGAITLRAAGPVDLASINVTSNGASGSNYYYAGAREAGGGGAVTISSTQSDLSLGHVSAIGGYGRSGTNGTVTDPNGGAAGAGGTGGSIHASAAGSLLLGGNIDASGGAGGTGGAGYYDSSLATPAYTGAGGAGGAGGNAGSITLSGASITLDNANVRVLGGYPGLGSSNGTVAGAQGAAGAGNALQLATAGDITVLGYNNLAGNPIAMLAGKAITLGNSASGSGGHINSTGSDTLLVANWNGSTDTPEVAGTAQCAALFCGISGIGSISNGYDYYEGYYYSGQLQNQNGGTITLKAAGPVDLQSIIVNSIGGAGGTYYYTGMQEAGSGGTVAISSTQSDVILGYVSVAGGSGQHGASGTLTDPNGGAGGAGGAGGSVYAGAAGALTLSGHINASGGSGGQGGSSYYDSGLATPAYTGTGGQGGAGGNAGTISLSGAAAILGAMLDANGGAGGSGGEGTAAGLAGAVGTGGNITLSATGGNLTLDSGAALSATAAGDALVLAAAGNFVNNAGASGLYAPNGRWLVYSTNPASDVRGDLPYAFKHYGLAYTGSAYAGPGIGNGLVYSVVPSLSADLTGTASKTYDGTTAGSLVLSNFSGVIDGDTVVLGGPASGVFADKNVGSGKSFSATVTLAGATNGAAAVYGSAIASGNIGEITPAPLTVSSPTVTKTYDGTTSVPSNFVASVGALAGAAGGGDTVATAASLAYADKNAGTGNKTVIASGLAIKDSLGADMTGNYAITYAPDVASTITPKAVTLSAPAVSKTYDGTTAYTAQTADLTALATPLVGGDTVSAATIVYANKNAGAGNKVVTLDAATINDGNNGANYTVTLAGNSASTINPAPLAVTLTGVNKVYDGLTTATVTGGTLSGAIAGDAVAVAGTGAFADKNVGVAKTVTVSSISLTGADAGNYTLSGTAPTTTADITVRPLSTWTGGASGNWSVAANWDALPDLSNVTAVSVPAGTTVTYDAAAGNTNLGSLTAAGLSITGGALSIANSLTVSSNFSHSAGTLGFGSNASANITQVTGDLIVRNLAAQDVSLTAQSGGVSQTGPIVASSLVTKSVTGTNLSDPGNQVSSFTATNSGSGNIVLTNKGALGVAGIANSGGNITLNNSGAISAAGALSAGGDISVVADALNLGSGASIDAGRDATLDASVGNLVATKAAVSAARDIKAQVAGDLKLNDGSSFTAGNDIWLTLTGANSTLYLNELAGMQPSYFWAKAQSTIHLDFTARTSGGLVMDGAAMSALSFKSNVGGSGMFFGPARESAGVGHGFEVTGISPPAVVPTEVAAVIETVSSTITSTITSSTTAASTVAASTTPKVEAPPPPLPVATLAGSGPLLLTSTTQTIGGTPGSFGGSPTAPSAPTPTAPAAAASTAVTSGTAASGDKPAADKPVADKPAGAKPEDDKSASAKKDESKAEEKKEDKKKEEEGGQKKQADKPAAKKLATCS